MRIDRRAARSGGRARLVLGSTARGDAAESQDAATVPKIRIRKLAR
ncbi:MAG: hypothetical protein OXM54_03230 [Acidimicrobiaceae bacterium]|nr:hypothetical protein [Acidimicrobiaceae bacterium]